MEPIVRILILFNIYLSFVLSIMFLYFLRFIAYKGYEEDITVILIIVPWLVLFLLPFLYIFKLVFS